MKFTLDINVYLHQTTPPGDPVLAELKSTKEQIMTVLDTLKAQVARTKEVSDSAVTLLQGLKAKLDDAIASGNPADLQALSDSLATETQELADAVSANTPADSGTPTDPTTPVDPDAVQ